MADSLLLVVEGIKDKQVIDAIMIRHNFEPKPVVFQEGGYEILRDRLSIYLKPGSDLDRFGIIVDADVKILSRWQSLRDVLSRCGYANLPILPDPQGFVVSHEILPRLGIWIMPDNAMPGMIEDYLTFLVPPGDRLLDLANRTLDSISDEDRRFADVHRAKALIHTWLAWQKKPGTPMGQAITSKYFSTEGEHVSVFLNWLTRLFA